MSEHASTTETPKSAEPQVLGMLAEFAGPDELVAGARAIREKGYKKVEAFSPFPIHGIDDALGAKAPILPWCVLGAGITGLVVALLMQWYMNAYEAPHAFSGYRFSISAKPYWSLPANIPVAFELVILFSAFTSFLGMIAFNKLPEFANPLFCNDRFRKATDDGFFLLVDAGDPLFADTTVKGALEEIGATSTEPLMSQPEEPMPGFIMPTGAVLAVLALIPLALIAFSRGSTSETPRLSIWWDMDYQPKYKSQTLVHEADDSSPEKPYKSLVFPHGRAMRMPVEGTVARGGLQLDSRYFRGIEPDAEETTPVAFVMQDEPSADEPSSEEPSAEEPAQDEPAAEEPAQDEPSEEKSAEEGSEEKPAETSENSEDEAPANDDSPEGEAAEDTPAEDAPAENAAPAVPEPNWVTTVPSQVKVNAETMQRGRQRFNIYCAACHGRDGLGHGIVAQRAQSAIVTGASNAWVPPANLHTELIRNHPIGKVYAVITHGNNTKMPGYSEQISTADRWAIALYVKALQRSRNVKADELPEDLKPKN